MLSLLKSNNRTPLIEDDDDEQVTNISNITDSEDDNDVAPSQNDSPDWILSTKEN